MYRKGSNTRTKLLIQRDFLHCLPAYLLSDVAIASAFSFQKIWWGDIFPLLEFSGGGIQPFLGEGWVRKVWFNSFDEIGNSKDSIYHYFYLGIYHNFFQFHFISTLVMLTFHFCLFGLS